MDAVDLRAALDAHAEALTLRGAEVELAVVEPPATAAEVAELESRLGLSLPPSFRETLETLSRSVRWSWQSPSYFPPPFNNIFGGGLEWSLDTVRDHHQRYLEWIETCFSNPANYYDWVWQGKLGFASVPNGDIIAVDLAPEQLGAIVYLSHEDGEGHGYVMANSLTELIDRWLPLACPGPEDWQWLPFVPHDMGPIDPACSNAREWRSLLGLHAAPPQTAPSTADDALFDSLMRAYRQSRTTPRGRRAALRALAVCSSNRAPEVIRLLHSEGDRWLQEYAVGRIGTWHWEPAVPDLKDVALGGSHNGRIAAMLALRAMTGVAAARARDELRSVLPADWSAHLGP